jgi:hypothetical protein
MLPAPYRFPKLDNESIEFVRDVESLREEVSAKSTKSVPKSVGLAMLQSLAFSAAGGASLGFGAGAGSASANSTFLIDEDVPSLGDNLEFVARPADSVQKFRRTRRSVAWSDPDRVVVSRISASPTSSSSALDALSRAVDAAAAWRAANCTQRVTLTLGADWVRIAAERALFDELLLADLTRLFRVAAARLRVLSVRRAYDLTHASSGSQKTGSAKTGRHDSALVPVSRAPAAAAAADSDEQPMFARVVIEIAADPIDAERAEVMHKRALALVRIRRVAAVRAAADKAALSDAVRLGLVPALLASGALSAPRSAIATLALQRRASSVALSPLSGIADVPAVLEQEPALAVLGHSASASADTRSAIATLALQRRASSVALSPLSGIADVPAVLGQEPELAVLGHSASASADTRSAIATLALQRRASSVALSPLSGIADVPAVLGHSSDSGSAIATLALQRRASSGAPSPLSDIADLTISQGATASNQELQITSAASMVSAAAVSAGEAARRLAVGLMGSIPGYVLTGSLAAYPMSLDDF